jgi:prolipoprotein diacylglyceryltransferase
LGMVAGTLVMVVLAVVTSARVSVALSLVSISCLVFIRFAVLRKRLTGVEHHGLFEGLWVVLGVAAAWLAALGLPIRLHLDLLAVGLSVFLIFGRMGCLVSGCCAGRPAPIGICYPHECGHADGNPRRFPVQLLEVLLWTGLSITGGLLLLLATPGKALSLILIAYGLARCFIEPLREPPRNGRRFGVSKSVCLALVTMAVGVVLADGPFLVSWPGTMSLTMGGTVALLLVGTRRRWLAAIRTLDDAQKTALREIGQALRQALPMGRVASWQVADCSVAASLICERNAAVLALSVGRRQPLLSRSEADLVLTWVTQAMGMDGPPLELIAGRTGFFLTLLPWRANPLDTVGESNPIA